jgi:mono/diheme cytochrome c family protein
MTRSVLRLLLAGLAVVGFAGSLLAQDAGDGFDARKVRLGKTIFSDKAQCFFCHGWAGDGVGNPQSDRGPSLRATELDHEQLAEVIRCGRPGARMPYHDRLAYTDDRCYGVTGDELGADKPPQAFNALQQREVDAVIEYLSAKVIGRGAPTFEECEDYFGANTKVCETYPHAAQ